MEFSFLQQMKTILFKVDYECPKAIRWHYYLYENLQFFLREEWFLRISAVNKFILATNAL